VGLCAILEGPADCFGDDIHIIAAPSVILDLTDVGVNVADRYSSPHFNQQPLLINAPYSERLLIPFYARTILSFSLSTEL